MDAAALGRLKLPDLKAKCRKLGITGYSKLGKAQIVVKLSEHASSSKESIRPTQVEPASPRQVGLVSKNRAQFVQEGKRERSEKIVQNMASEAEEGVDKLGTFVVLPGVARQIAEESKLTSLEDCGPGQGVVEETNHGTAQSESRTTKRPRLVPIKKGKTAATALLKPAVKFQPLLTRPTVSTLRGSAVPREPRPCIDTTCGRVDYVCTSFLDQMFQALHKARTSPIFQAPYPTPHGARSTSRLAFQGLHPSLYNASETGEIAFAIGLRFWISRLYSMLSLGSGEAWSNGACELGILPSDLSEWPVVTGIEILECGLAKVTTSERVGYIVLPATGEVIAHSRVEEGEFKLGGCVVRSDWYSVKDGMDVQKYIRTKDRDSAPGGVSATWRVRATGEELVVAERVAISSCTPESFSGPNLSAAEMDAEYIGRPGDAKGSKGVELYLPESRQIESIHLPANLHPDLAIALRSSGISDYVLYETGQVVGDEHEGVAPLWQGVLGCDGRGLRKDSSDFWAGWEGRIM